MRIVVILTMETKSLNPNMEMTTTIISTQKLIIHITITIIITMINPGKATMAPLIMKILKIPSIWKNRRTFLSNLHVRWRNKSKFSIKRQFPVLMNRVM
jgi:hypothetical protein